MAILQNDKSGKKIWPKVGVGDINIILLLIYTFTMPFVSAFAFSGTLSYPIIFAFILFLLMLVEIVKENKLPVGFLGFDVVIILMFLLLVVFSFLINGLGNSKSLNHTIAYISTFLLFYVSIKFTLFQATNKSVILRKVLQFICYITLISAFYANVEFISANLFDINLNDYIPRPTEEEKFYEALVVGLFYRARGFAPESGHFSFMLELFIPLTVYYMFFSGLCRWIKSLKIFFIVVIILSLIFAGSPVSFIVLPVSIFISVLIYGPQVFKYLKSRASKILVPSLLIAIILLLINYVLSFSELLILNFTAKADSNSYFDRQERVDFFFNQLSKFELYKKLIGAGPAGFDILGFDDSKSILSLYYSIIFEVGFLGLLLFGSLFIYIVFRVAKIKDKIGFFFLVSLLSGIMHYYVIANYWYPWFWFVATFAIFYANFFSSHDKKT